MRHWLNSIDLRQRTECLFVQVKQFGNTSSAVPIDMSNRPELYVIRFVYHL